MPDLSKVDLVEAAVALWVHGVETTDAYAKARAILAEAERRGAAKAYAECAQIVEAQIWHTEAYNGPTGCAVLALLAIRSRIAPPARTNRMTRICAELREEQITATLRGDNHAAISIGAAIQALSQGREVEVAGA